MTSIILPYSKECKNARLEFENYIIGSQNQYSKTNPSKANYLSKVQTYTHRFALLFQVMSSVLEGEQLDNISIVSFMRARKVMDYFQNNMFAIFDFEKEKQLKKLCNNDIKYRWYKSLEQQFKTIDAKELLQSINETVEMGSHRDKKTIEAIDKNVTNWLQNDVLFTKLYHGMYEKNF
jgi:ATP-dependent Lon protease